MNTNRIIDIWGVYPPPIGGVSMHIKRLIFEINKYQKVILKDFKPKTQYPFDFIIPVKNPFFEVLRLPFVRKRIIHIEHFSYLFFIIFLSLGAKHKIGITIHNQRSILIKSKWKYWLCRLFFKKCSFIIMNDVDFKPRFASFFNVKEDKIHVLPAFLPPSDMERIGLSDSVISFRQQHDFLISANGYRVRLDDGVDVYGLDMLIMLVSKLREKGINAGLLFCLPEIGDVKYYSFIKSQINNLHIIDHVLFIEGNNENGFEYWENSDLFIRPTSTDMEGISIKEALSVGRNVIASDVCQRPKECFLFKNRDMDDLLHKTLDFYKSGYYNKKVKYKHCIDVAKETIIIYNTI